MPGTHDGPRTAHFQPLPLAGNRRLAGVPGEMAAAVAHAPSGACTAWGIPFEVGDVVVLDKEPVAVALPPTRARWLVFMHTAGRRPEPPPEGLVSRLWGEDRLGEHAADYVLVYEDGTEARLPIRRRQEIGACTRPWGMSCMQAVAHRKPRPVRAHHEQLATNWGESQVRCTAADEGPWVNWLWAWENPRPEAAIVGLRFEPVAGVVVVSAVSAGDVSSHPLRWRPRRKALLALPEGEALRPELDEHGLLAQLQLDMGQVISATTQPLYPAEGWEASDNNQLPGRVEGRVLVEYTAHPDACFHLASGRILPVADVEVGQAGETLQPVAPATQRVTLRVLERGSGRPVAVKLHVHGEAGEYLAPVDRHRVPNPAWFEDYSVDFTHLGAHHCTYIPGEATIDLPLGRVYVEVSKGFEIRPIRRVVEVTEATEEITVELEKVLPWRERGWVTADTHVHFLSPVSALQEGAGEGVNVVNLLASQWGELMTNVGDFDGRTTWGSREAGGEGEYLVRVGTENRQHVLGHISLLGYNGRIIAPMTCGGADESALGDPIEALLSEWARQCKAQGGLVVVPHFPRPRAEHAAAIVSGDVDAVEMTSWEDLYSGIDPYSLWDWYRYLNCGYMLAAVGGTDKMNAATAVGTVRTYARIAPGRPFDYPAWMDAVRRAETFVTYGPLLEFYVDGRPMGSRIQMGTAGGTVDVTWQAASVTIPISRVDLVVNGEVRESAAVPPVGQASSPAHLAVHEKLVPPVGQASSPAHLAVHEKLVLPVGQASSPAHLAVHEKLVPPMGQASSPAHLAVHEKLIPPVGQASSPAHLAVHEKLSRRGPLPHQWEASGHWSVRVERSAWLALLVRGHYAGRPEIVAAHSSPVMVDVAGSPMLAAADGVSILEQIEGALAYIDTVGTRAEDLAYKRMRLVLQAAHRTLHNRLHQLGYYHDHTVATDHGRS